MRAKRKKKKLFCALNSTFIAAASSSSSESSTLAQQRYVRRRPCLPSNRHSCTLTLAHLNSVNHGGATHQLVSPSERQTNVKSRSGRKCSAPEENKAVIQPGALQPRQVIGSSLLAGGDIGMSDSPLVTPPPPTPTTRSSSSRCRRSSQVRE